MVMKMKLNKKYLIIGSLSSLILAGSITGGVLLTNNSSIKTTSVQQSLTQDVSNQALINGNKAISLHQLQINAIQWNHVVNSYNEGNSQPLAEVLFNSASRFLKQDYIPGNVNSIQIKSIKPDPNNADLTNVVFNVGGNQISISIKQSADYKNTETNIWLIILVSVGSAALVVAIFTLILKHLSKRTVVTE